MLRLPLLTKSLRTRNLRSIIQPRVHTFHSYPLLKASASNYKKGDELHGFVVDEVASIDELFVKSIKLTHQKTNAQYLHLERDDSNNVFAVAFRTTPMNSSGIPHILEHLVLCGSEKYPCRDPFFQMLRRSVANFMNAFTAPDHTFYPFSTQNKKDFQNLQSIYLDCVLRPNLREVDFWQEGWRLEHTDPNDKTSPIIFKGVVFNEMKGVFNNDQHLLMYGVMNKILPSHTYGVISGGNPMEIPNLDYEQLRNFYQTYYHPSNSRIFSYGNFPLEDHLKLMNEEYLSGYEKIDVSNTKVPSEPRWTSPRRAHFTSRFNPLVANPEKQSTIAISQICNVVNDLDTTFDFAILSQLLLKGPNSAFYKSLVDTKIGSGFVSFTGYETSIKDTMFALGLQEVRAEDFEKVEQIYDETLQKVVKEGFNKNQIEAILHILELHNKHQSSNFGLHLLFTVAPFWNHDGDVVKYMRINESIAKFRKNLESNPRYLEELVEKYLINNNHKLIATMSPDANFEADLVAKEKALLDSKLSKLSEEDLEKIYENGQRLLKDQAKKPTGDILPMLKLEDLRKDVERYSFEELKIEDVPVQLSVQPTNGICYYRSILNTKHLPAELKLYLPLFNEVLMKMGTQNFDYRQFDELIHLKTGGLSIVNHVAELKDNLSSYEEGIHLFSYCLNQNTEEMWKIWDELFNRHEFKDLQRFETLVKMHVANLLNGISHSGHMYAMSSAASIVSPVAKFKESLGGFENINRLKGIAQMKDLTPVLENLEEIASLVLKKDRMRSAINVSSESRDKVLSSIESYHCQLDGKTDPTRIITQTESSQSVQKAIHHVLPYDVNYTSKAILTVPYVHPDYPVLRVIAKMVTWLYLHPEIREKGNAYGGGAKMTADGIFAFYSYRDPNSTRTFDIYDAAYDFLSKRDISDQELTEAKLSVFQELDAPVSPDARGILHFSQGFTYDDLQNTRLRIKEISREDVLRVAEKYLKEGNVAKVGRALIGPSDESLKGRSSENWEVSEQEVKKASVSN